jgi:hypothetical protein
VGPELADEIFIELDPYAGLEVGRSGWKSQLVLAHYRRLHQALPTCSAQIRPVHRGFVASNRGNDFRDKPAAECYPAGSAARLKLVAKSSNSSTDH